ncbi:MAG: DUF2892 domain-containing protein [Rhodomicrobium sp.]
MSVNVGTIDRILRIIVGAALLYWGVYVQGAWWGWIGVVPVLTALVGYCPAYSIVGLRTCSRA